MPEDSINFKRIRDSAPYRKSMSLTEMDLMRAAELERIFNTRFPGEVPFNFSKTISKAIELAFLQMLQSSPGSVQQSLSGLPADQTAIQARTEKKLQEGSENQSGTREPEFKSTPQRVSKQGKPKKYQKTKRGF